MMPAHYLFIIYTEDMTTTKRSMMSQTLLLCPCLDTSEGMPLWLLVSSASFMDGTGPHTVKDWVEHAACLACTEDGLADKPSLMARALTLLWKTWFA